jgi:hypothetical protein
VSVAIRNDWGMMKTYPAFSALNLTVHSEKGGAVLRGPTPSVVQLSLIPTTFQDTVLQSQKTGYVLQFIDSEVGSIADSARFHEVDAEVSFMLELRTARTTYRLVSAPQKSVFDMAAQMLGILSGMSLIARILVALLGDGPAQMGCAEHCRPACAACTYPCVSPCLAPLARCLCCFLPAEDEDARRSFFDTKPKNFQPVNQRERSHSGEKIGSRGNSPERFGSKDRTHSPRSPRVRANSEERQNGDSARSSDALVAQNDTSRTQSKQGPAGSE